MAQIEKNSSQPINSRPGCLALFGLAWTGFSTIFLLVGISQGDIIFTLFGGGFTLIGLALIGYSVMVWYTRFRVGRPQINIAKTTLKVGEQFNVYIDHQFNRSVEVEDVSVTLIFKETATYQQGTDTRTVTHEHIVQEFTEPGRNFRGGQYLQLQYDLQIPYNAMHSLDVRRNKLEWLLRFKLVVPRLPDFNQEHRLTVLPEMER